MRELNGKLLPKSGSCCVNLPYFRNEFLLLLFIIDQHAKKKKRRNKHVCLRDVQFVLPNWINAYTESESCSAVSNSWQPHSPGNSPVLNTAVPFSRGSSQPRDPTQVSRIVGRFFTSWATREAQKYWSGEPVPSPADLPDPELDWGLLHCRHTLYQLSYQGSLYRTVH